MYHLDIPFIQGGFIGVDIFFVISGYLITYLLLFEYENKNLNVFKFLIRRIKRILPALSIVVMASLFCAALIFSPIDFHRLIDSFYFSLFGLSNIYLWFESGYFDASNQIKPDLHIWSLGIELQFYFIWTILIYCLMRYKRNWLLMAVIITIFCLSLISNLIVLNQIKGFDFLIPNFIINKRESAVFYLLPFRLFEFSIGAVAAYFGRVCTFRIPVILSDIIVFLCLSFIIMSAIYINDSLSFPSTTAIIPCFSVAFIIYFARYSRLGNLILGNSVATNIGLLSYSIYLIHWPILVFWRYSYNIDFPWFFYPMYIFVLLILSNILHKVVERPLRQKIWFRYPIANNKIIVLIISFIIFFPSLLDSTIISNNDTLIYKVIENTERSNNQTQSRHESCEFQDFSAFKKMNALSKIKKKSMCWFWEIP